MPFDHFNFLAAIYDRVIHPFDGIGTMMRLADLPAAGRLLDVGGGTGRVADTLRGQAQEIVIADSSLMMLGKAANKGGFGLTASHSEYLPFPSNSFDRIIMVDALHHVCNQQETANELMRVLIPGGRIVIQEPDIENFTVRLIAVAEKLALMRSHFLSGEQIAALFYPAASAVERVYEDFQVWVIVRK
ncbi:MAG: class I SAM-dependent methyltransferase [Anaerolineales bacterium]|nr:class I SAM-dependent methyltransferase [Anaerolineales bacterium]